MKFTKNAGSAHLPKTVGSPCRGQRLGGSSGGRKLGFGATALPSFLPFFDAVFSLPEIAIDYGSDFCIAD